MAVYVAKQPGFGDRIGLFAGIDEVRFKRVVVPGDTAWLEITMEKLGSRFGKDVPSPPSMAKSHARGSFPSSFRPRTSCDEGTSLRCRHPRAEGPRALHLGARSVSTALARVLGSALRCTTSQAVEKASR